MASNLIGEHFSLLVMLAIFVVLIGGNGWAFWKLFKDPTRK
jgi:hypothetical protein